MSFDAFSRLLDSHDHLTLGGVPDGLEGRVLSSSYVPDVGEPGYSAMMDELERVFKMHEEDGLVAIEYETQVYYGRLGWVPHGVH